MQIRRKKNKYNHKMRFWLYFGFADVTIAMENIMNKIKRTIQKITNQPPSFVNQEENTDLEQFVMKRRKCCIGCVICTVPKAKGYTDFLLLLLFLLCFAFIQLDCFARWFCQQMNVMRRTTVQHKSIHGTGNKFIQQFATDQETPSDTCGLSLNWNQIQAISLSVHYESILSLSAIVLDFSFYLYFPLNLWMIL